ncbi:hypothetical protein AB0O06_41855 [Streptomyces tauricus]
MRFHPVTGRGIRINYRTYDHACLNEHRGRPCPTGPDGKYEIHLNPHDVRQVYIRLPDGHLHEIPWIHRDHVHAPMGETAWRHIRATLHRRAGRERHEADLAEAADEVLRRARPLPGHGAPAAAAAGAACPQATDNHGEAQDSLDAAAVEAAVDARDGDGLPADGDELSPPAGPFALYDAFEEAEHW